MKIKSDLYSVVCEVTDEKLFKKIESIMDTIMESESEKVITLNYNVSSVWLNEEEVYNEEDEIDYER
jgi:hypothetical protein